MLADKTLDGANDGQLSSLASTWRQVLEPLTEDPDAAIAEINRQLRSCIANEKFQWLISDSHQQVASEMLKDLGCTVQVAENGEQAIHALKATSDPFKIILMDCQMPVMDGYEASRKIRASSHPNINPEIPIIALTANAMKGDEDKCFEAGMNDYLAKPVNVDMLFALMRILLFSQSKAA